MKKIGIFLDEIKDKSIDDKQKFSKLGFNTGNMLFWHSLKIQLNLDIKSRWYIDHIDQLDLSEYKAFVTTDLIWIRQMQDFSYLNKTLDIIGDLPLIPISIGLQSNTYDPDFKLHPETVKVIKRIEERCIMGVRGKYTAKILTKYGINNFKIIGCPSMYMNAPGIISVANNKTPMKVSMNFETFYDAMDKRRVDLLKYGMKQGFSFIEQAQSDLNESHITDKNALSDIKKWINEKGKLFFDLDEWRNYLKQFDFSIGARFHGNVLALWEGVPSLFITCDSRTQELCEHFSLPHINIREFDSSKPIEYYYGLADYSEFHRNYENRVQEWKEFLEVNEIEEKNMVLYHCFTAYQFLELLIHKQQFHKNEYAVLLVPGDFRKLNPSLDKFINNEFFSKLIMIHPNEGFNNTDDEIEKRIKEYYDSIFKMYGLNYLDFKNIYVAGAYRNFGIYASIMRIPFSIFEDASGTLSSDSQYLYDSNNSPSMAYLIDKYGLYYGNGELIKKVYCDLRNQNKPINEKTKVKIHDFIISSEFKKLDENLQNKILSIYNCPKSMESDITLIFTQWFIFNNSICEDKRIILHYQYLCDIFADRDNIMIKIHPADPLDYNGHFSDCILSTSKFPSELIKCCGFNVRKVISINSTANNAFEEAENIKIKQNPFSPLEIYNKLLVIGKILQIFSEHNVYCYGIDEKFIEKFYRFGFNLNKCVSWKMPIDQPQKSILIIDYLNWGKGTNYRELPSIINSMPYDSLYIFLNRRDVNFESLKLNELFDFAVPIILNLDKTKVNPIYNTLNEEIIWIFTRNLEYQDKLRNFSFERILKQVGIKIVVNQLSSNLEKSIKIEERINTITRALINMEENK